jgi:hypothetical protein
VLLPLDLLPLQQELPAASVRVGSVVVIPTVVVMEDRPVGDDSGGLWEEVISCKRQASRSPPPPRPVPADLNGLCFNCFIDSHFAARCPHPARCFWSCRCLNLSTSIGGTHSKVEGGDRHDLEPEGTREDTRHKIYTGSGSQSSYPTSCLE